VQPGFGGRITISLRSEAKHPQGELQARGICALTPKRPIPNCFAVTTVRAEVSKPITRLKHRVR
jgi:hypothetical protein